MVDSSKTQLYVPMQTPTSGTSIVPLTFVGWTIPRMLMDMFTRSIYDIKHVINNIAATLNRAGIRSEMLKNIYIYIYIMMNAVNRLIIYYYALSNANDLQSILQLKNNSNQNTLKIQRSCE